MYALGVDLGTTYTAAATWREGAGEIVSLGTRAATVPSVVLLRSDGTVLTGEAASRRGLTEPDRVAREFKRRLGDPTPILLGGAPYSAEALTGKLLRAVLDQVTDREGGPPSRVCLSHPANWGPYKTDLLKQAVRLADLAQPVTYTSEPEAAAAFYAHQQRLEPGAVVAVYDLGGGTFDAAVLRKTAAGFEILGQPEGIERLGGIDFDASVFDHVRRSLAGKVEELDEDDAAAVAAVGRLREECVQAKEALSADTDVSIPVLLPNVNTEVRLTRAELEAMVGPVLDSSIEALRRALRTAGVTAEELHSVLLVGGSSRIPVVSQLVAAELGRPVAVDAHPKHAVALGAALLAAGPAALTAPTASTASTASTATKPAGPGPAAAAAAGAAAGAMAGAAAGAAGAAAAGPAAGTTAAGTTATGTTAAGAAATGAAAVPPSPALAARTAAHPGFATGTAAVAGSAGTTDPDGPADADPEERAGRRRWPLVLAGVLLLVLLGTGGAAYALRGDDPGGDLAAPAESPSPSPTPEPTPSATTDPPVTDAGDGDGGGNSGTGSGTGNGGTGQQQQQPTWQPPATPTIVEFVVTQQPTCPAGGGGATVWIRWKVAHADEVALSVDNPGVVGSYGTYGLEGSETFSFSCSAPGTTESHTYTIHTVGGGTQVHRTLTVSAEVPAAPVITDEEEAP